MTAIDTPTVCGHCGQPATYPPPPPLAADADEWAVATALAAQVRVLHHAAVQASRASQRAITAASTAYSAEVAAVLVWRTLTAALVDGAGQDKAPKLADAVAAARAHLAPPDGEQQ